MKTITKSRFFAPDNSDIQLDEYIEHFYGIEKTQSVADQQQDLLIILKRYIDLFKNRDSLRYAIACQIYDTLIFEQYFPMQLNNAQRFPTKLVGQYLEDLQDKDEIEIHLNKLYDVQHPIRGLIFYLDSILIVREIFEHYYSGIGTRNSCSDLGKSLSIDHKKRQKAARMRRAKITLRNFLLFQVDYFRINSDVEQNKYIFNEPNKITEKHDTKLFILVNQFHYEIMDDYTLVLFNKHVSPSPIEVINLKECEFYKLQQMELPALELVL